MTQSWSLFIGLDAGPAATQATVMTTDGDRIYDKPLPRHQYRLHQWLARLREHGPVITVIENAQCADSFEATVLASLGCQLAIIPGFDARSIPAIQRSPEPNAISRLLAHSARTMPNELQIVPLITHDESAAAALGRWVEDLEHDLHLATSRLESTVSRFHPALARACAGRWQHRAILDVFSTCGGPVGIDRYTRADVVAIARPHAPRAAEAIAADLTAALAQQDVSVPGVSAIDRVVQAQAATVVALLGQLEQARELWHESCDAAALTQLMEALARKPQSKPLPRQKQPVWPVVGEQTPRMRRRAERRRKN